MRKMPTQDGREDSDHDGESREETDFVVSVSRKRKKAREEKSSKNEKRRQKIQFAKALLVGVILSSSVS